MNEDIDKEVFEWLIHLLELSVVLGIGVIIWITRKYSKKINQDLEDELNDR